MGAGDFQSPAIHPMFRTNDRQTFRPLPVSRLHATLGEQRKSYARIILEKPLGGKRRLYVRGTAQPTEYRFVVPAFMGYNEGNGLCCRSTGSKETAPYQLTRRSKV